MDLGSCPKHHALALRADYEKALGRGKDYDYDLDAMEHLTNFIAGKFQIKAHLLSVTWEQLIIRIINYPLSFHSDCDRRTEQAKKRLAETQEELSAEASAKASIVNELGEQIGVTLAKVGVFDWEIVLIDRYTSTNTTCRIYHHDFRPKSSVLRVKSKKA